MKWRTIAGIVGIVLVVPGIYLTYVGVTSQLQGFHRDVSKGTIHYVLLENTNTSIQHDFTLNESVWASFTFYANVTLYYSDQNSSYWNNSNLVPHLTVTSPGVFYFYDMSLKWARPNSQGGSQVRFTIQIHYSQGSEFSRPFMFFMFRCLQCKSTPHFLVANFNLSADAILL